jgi:hypothetical protein
MRSSILRVPFFGLVVAAFVVAGCTSSDALVKQDLAGKRIAATAAIPPEPYVFHHMLAAARVYPHDPQGRPPAGAAAAEQRRVERLERTLRGAAKQVDVALRIADGLVQTATRDLGTAVSRTVDAADYVLDIRVYHYGLTMRSSHLPASFFIEAEAVLTDPAGEEVLWQERIERTGVHLTGQLTGAEMAHATEKLLAVELEHLADDVAARLSRDLRRASR